MPLAGGPTLRTTILQGLFVPVSAQSLPQRPLPHPLVMPSSFPQCSGELGVCPLRGIPTPTRTGPLSWGPRGLPLGPAGDVLQGGWVGRSVAGGLFYLPHRKPLLGSARLHLYAPGECWAGHLPSQACLYNRLQMRGPLLKAKLQEQLLMKSS